MNKAKLGKMSFQAFAGSLKGTFAPVYLFYGEEPLQRFEAGSLLRAAARSRGYARKAYCLVLGFDWSKVMVDCANLSLFAEKELLAISHYDSKFPTNAAKHLMELISVQRADTVLLFDFGKVDMRSGWAKRALEIGVVVEMRNKSASQMKNWVAQRGKTLGLDLSWEAVDAIVGKAENNMVAAANVIASLSLLCPDGKIDLESLRSLFSDSARFDVYKLVDAALNRETARTVRILRRLEYEKAPPSLLLWALADRLRLLATMESLEMAGKNFRSVLSSQWPARRKSLQFAFERSQAPHWARLLSRCAEVDAIIKGVKFGNEWRELLELLLSVSGSPTRLTGTVNL